MIFPLTSQEGNDIMNEQSPVRQQAEPFRLQRILAVLSAVSILIGSLCFARWMQPERQAALAEMPRPILVIDPGHGGIDGGAIAFNGVKESELNLAICLKMQDLAAFYGLAAVMTRMDDSAADASRYSEREDLARRADIANALVSCVLFSIHQNTFPTSQPSGAQVLYGPDAESRRLGEMTQRNLVEGLQPENRRVAAPAPRELYLTAHAHCPVVLVECGFLSNLSDLQLLSDNRYQSSLAAALLGTYLQFTDTSRI